MYVILTVAAICAATLGRWGVLRGALENQNGSTDATERDANGQNQIPNYRSSPPAPHGHSRWLAGARWCVLRTGV
jgi:hypothetical protein